MYIVHILLRGNPSITLAKTCSSNVHLYLLYTTLLLCITTCKYIVHMWRFIELLLPEVIGNF